MKKIATLMGVAVVSLGVLAGCGGKPSSSNTPAPSGSSQSSSSQSSGQSSSSNAASGSAKEVKVVGSNWKIDVTQPEIKAGDKVKLVFSSKEGVHGYTIKDTSVKTDPVTGSDKVVEWTPDKPGEYEVFCNMVCGPTDKHEAMKSKIVVK